MRAFLFASCILASALPAAAENFYECSFDQDPNSWVPQSMIFAHAPDQKHVVVADPVTMQFAGGPMQARIARQSTSALRFNWTVKEIRDSRGNLASMRYRAKVDLKTGAVSVSAKALGFSESFSGKGKCARIPQGNLDQIMSLADKIK